MDLAYDSAFPVPGMPPVGTGDPRDGMAGGYDPQPGISVRAYIATKVFAMMYHPDNTASMTKCAEDAVKAADALIAELNK